MSSRVCSLAAGGSWYLGPLHPLSHGQLYVELTDADDRLAGARIDWSRQQRLDEKLFEVRDLTQGLALANRSGWLTPSGLECAYAEAAEQILGLPVPARAQSLRRVVNLMQQAAGLLLRLAGIADLLDQPTAGWLQSREQWLQLLEKMTGARIHDTYLRIGGVAADLPAEMAEEILALCDAVLPVLDASSLRSKAKLPAEQAAGFGLTGVPGGDSDAAQRVEFLRNEVVRIASELRKALMELSPGNVATTLPKSLRLPVGNAHSTWPTATGDVSVWLHGNGGKSPLRVAVTNNSQRAASLFEAEAAGRTEADAYLLLATLPLSPGELAL